MNIKFDIKGLDKLKASYSAYKVNQVMRLFHNKLGVEIIRFLKDYPSQRNPNTDYVRGFGFPPNRRVSENLGSQWGYKYSHKDTRVFNNASYSGYVQRLEFQAEIHQDWWQTDQDAIDSVLPDELERLENIIERL